VVLVAAGLRVVASVGLVAVTEPAAVAVLAVLVGAGEPQVPNALRASRQERKIVLKALARKLLPRTLDLDRKQGFSIPLSRWITAPLVDSWLEECRQQVAMVLCEREIRALSRQESSAATERLFAFMLLTLWMRDYGVTVT